MALKQYCLEMSHSLWNDVDKNRMALVGTLYPQGVTRADYIREAVTQYNKWNAEVIAPKMTSLKKEIDEPIGFYIDDGLDVKW
jgi:hypothetical protein